MRLAWVLTGTITLAECGATAPSSGETGETLPSPMEAEGDVIEIGADSELAVMLGSDTPSELFAAAPGLEYPAGTATRWNGSTDPPTEDEVRRLADLVGVSGEVATLDDGFGPGLVVGSPESDGGTLAVKNHAEPHWYVQRSERFLIEMGAIPCPTLAFDDANAGQCANGVAPTDRVPPTDTIVDATVARLMSGLGVSADSYRTETYPVRSTTEVTIEFSADGLRSDVSWSMTVSSSGDILSGSGPLRTPSVVDEVPTVSLDEALIRLSRVAPGVPAVTVPRPTTSLLAAPATIDSERGVVTTAPPPTAPPTPIVLPTITGVEPGLVSVWDVANRLWLVPAIVVTGDFGFTTSIPVISAEMVRFVDPALVEVPVRTGPPLTVPVPPPSIAVPAPSPVPPDHQQSIPLPTTTEFPTTPPTATVQAPRTTPAPGGEPSDQPIATLPVPPDTGTPPTEVPGFYDEVLNGLLVGEPLDGAWTRLLDAGWEVRVDDLDDPTETFTADLRVDRATIQHRNGIVTSLSVG